MTGREKHELAYQFAFWPDALNQRLHAWKKDPSLATEDELEALDNAALLHLPLPESGYAAFGQVARLAIYQAIGCQYGMRGYVKNIRRRLGRPEITADSCPASLLADVSIPGFEAAKGLLK